MLLERKEERSDEFDGNFVYGYFDELPTPEEAASAYFEGKLPDDWPSFPECAVLEDGFNVKPERTEDGWRVLLGDAC